MANKNPSKDRYPLVKPGTIRGGYNTEKAEAFKKFREQGMTVKESAKAAGFSETTIRSGKLHSMKWFKEHKALTLENLENAQNVVLQALQKAEKADKETYNGLASALKSINHVKQLTEGRATSNVAFIIKRGDE